MYVSMHAFKSNKYSYRDTWTLFTWHHIDKKFVTAEKCFNVIGKPVCCVNPYDGQLNHI